MSAGLRSKFLLCRCLHHLMIMWQVTVFEARLAFSRLLSSPLHAQAI